MLRLTRSISACSRCSCSPPRHLASDAPLASGASASSRSCDARRRSAHRSCWRGASCCAWKRSLRRPCCPTACSCDATHRACPSSRRACRLRRACRPRCASLRASRRVHPGPRTNRARRGRACYRRTSPHDAQRGWRTRQPRVHRACDQRCCGSSHRDPCSCGSAGRDRGRTSRVP